jgi:hypothetical protein
MVQVASLRIQIEANQAKQAAQEVRRELDAVTVAATKTEVSTDKLERQMAELLAVNKAVALNTHASAVAIQQLGQRQQTTAVHVERTTEKMVKQETAGKKLRLIFGELASKTAATGGAFLAADFLARVAGATSLMDGLNKVMNKTAEAVRGIFIAEDSFADKLTKAVESQRINLEKIQEMAIKARLGQTGPALELAAGAGGIGLGGVDLANANQLSRLEAILAKANAALAENARQQGILGRGALGGGQFNAAASGLPAGTTKESLAAQRQSIIDQTRYAIGLVGETQVGPARQRQAVQGLAGFASPIFAAAMQAGVLNAAVSLGLAGGSKVPLGGPRSGAGIAGGAAFAAAGFPGTSPAGIGIGLGTLGVSAAQNYAQAQGYRGGSFSSSDASPGGNFFVQSMSSAAAASGVYAANLVKITEQQERAARSARQFGESAAGAFEDAVFSSGALSERIEGLISGLTRAVFNIVVTQQLASAIGGFFGGGGGGSFGGQSAKGNVFSMGSLVPFANGGIVHGPTVFPMSGGKSGLMGEAGPEAIMPLGRNSKGELGVKGGSTVNFYISTPDVEGFRKSRKQISADLRRMVS